MHKFLCRWLRHRWADDAFKSLPADIHTRTAEAVRASEALHRAEICVSVDSSLPTAMLLRRVGTRAQLVERARILFSERGVWDTAENNGILLYMCLAEHAVEIVFDRGLRGAADEQWWRDLAHETAVVWREKGITVGIEHFVRTVTPLLISSFPVRPGEAAPNELPDSPAVQGYLP
jgi:uncharacterized membrane protein